MAYQTTRTSGFIHVRVPRYVSPALSITRRVAVCAAAVMLMDSAKIQEAIAWLTMPERNGAIAGLLDGVLDHVRSLFGMG